ncbi:hypothetical protein QBC46DRAFT_431408 [Diplogelasinospora grovesii]|uniref:Uncharacterized protein n=1 Tax=Diplogelasinospora grovesii TaxID=303347 RepID=A0AAN6MXM9_9PEZI|nr:hypothetical protein QBC46DRAFT_431408 [Diplogelasinospora grovesii]
MRPSPLALLLFSSHASSFTVLQRNCTLPITTTNSSSSCLTIIILCTWNILHLNVPALALSAVSGARGLRLRAAWWLRDQCTKLKWALIAVLTPEYLLGKALGEWRAARFALTQCRHEGWRKPEEAADGESQHVEKNAIEDTGEKRRAGT